MQIPKTLNAGDSWTWTDSDANYPASSWTLAYHFRGSKNFSLVGVASGDDQVFTATTAVTQDLLVGDYDWIARAVNGAVSTTLGTGRVRIQPNLANLAGDNRSFNQIVLDSLEAVIKNRATTDQLSLSIAGRSISRMSWQELRDAYDYYKLAVAKEQGKRPSRVLYRTGLA